MNRPQIDLHFIIDILNIESVYFSLFIDILNMESVYFSRKKSFVFNM